MEWYLLILISKRIVLFLAGFLAIDFSKFLEFKGCLAYTGLSGLVVDFVDVCENGIHAGFDVLYEFFHDLDSCC